jgi:putative DNA primase/helicase
LSTGELDLPSHIEATQKRTYGGQEVRFCGIPAQADETNGAFESLHRFKSPKLFAAHLFGKSGQHFGIASREFLHHIVRMGRGTVRERVQRYRREFVGRFLSGSEGADVARAGDRFALVAAAGELLTEVGITGWKPGEAMEGTGKCFREWIKALGTDGNLDEKRALGFFN